MQNLMLEDIRSKVEVLAKKICGDQGLELIELKVNGSRNGKKRCDSEGTGNIDVHIQILADKPSGGINMGECVILNKSLVAAIEQENFLPREVFSLEVSSPGTDRPKHVIK